MMKALLIDDMEYARSILKEALEKENIEVDEANNGQQALEKIKKYKFDVVLLDLILGDIDGIELLKQIKSIDNNLRAIITTGYSDQKKISNCLDNGAEHFFAKLIDTNRLIDVIKNY